MKIAVLSGKGGAGKTFLAVNLAAALGKATYVDCDVEEPNGRLFLKPEVTGTQDVFQMIPSFDAQKCTGCKKCVNFCRFHALIYIKKAPMLFTEVCHSCGGCSLVCPDQAICEVPRPIGVVQQGMSSQTRVLTGVLNTGEASGIGVIQKALSLSQKDDTVIIDCPPGSACSVQESIRDADFCLLAAEPTAFGFQNFQMVWELAVLHGKPCGVEINKQETPYAPLEQFCQEHEIPILLRIPYDRDLGGRIADGQLLARQDPAFRKALLTMADQIGGLCR